MAQPEIRKRCTVTSLTATTAYLTPTTNDKSPAVPLTSVQFVASAAHADFWAGSGRYDVIVRRL